LTRPNTSARNPLPDDGSHPGGIKSESRAASSRYRWATSSESAAPDEAGWDPILNPAEISSEKDQLSPGVSAERRGIQKHWI
jgi:hypothetical protein